MREIAVVCYRRSGTSFQFSDATSAIETLSTLGYVQIKSKARQHEVGRYANTGAVAIVYTSGSVVAAGERAGRLVFQLARLANEPVEQLAVAAYSPDHLAHFLWCSHPARFAAQLERAGWRHWESAESDVDAAGYLPLWVLCAPKSTRPFGAIKCNNAGVLKLIGDDTDAWEHIDPLIYYTKDRHDR